MKGIWLNSKLIKCMFSFIIFGKLKITFFFPKLIRSILIVIGVLVTTVLKILVKK